ncbi:acyl-CoA N-acyltransferase, partial [Aureobasidium melanogenum]
MFFTERLMLRGLDPDVDNAIWLQWTNTVESLHALSVQGPQPWTRERSKQFLETRVKDMDALPWFIVCEKPALEDDCSLALGPNDDCFRTSDGNARYPAIGILAIDKVGKAAGVNRIVSFGILLSKDYQGRGLGTEVLRWMCNYIFTTLGYRRIELSLDATNDRALRCYRHVGFVEEGRRRKQFWREGEFRDVIEMAMLEEEWSSFSWLFILIVTEIIMFARQNLKPWLGVTSCSVETTLWLVIFLIAIRDIVVTGSGGLSLLILGVFL